MNEADAMISACGLVKTYDAGIIRALDGLDFGVARGEFVAVTGPSGCGKSTLLHLIAALDRPDAGELAVAGHDLVREQRLDHYRARHVGMVFQLHNLLPTLSAAENVQVPMFELGLDARARSLRAADLLGLVGLSGRARNRPAELSGGERQRVAVARALANAPSILLADEPTGSLDSRSGAALLDLLEEIRAEHETTLVLVTHDAAIATRAGRIVHMLDGRTRNGDPFSVPATESLRGTTPMPSGLNLATLDT